MIPTLIYRYSKGMGRNFNVQSTITSTTMRYCENISVQRRTSSCLPHAHRALLISRDIASESFRFRLGGALRLGNVNAGKHEHFRPGDFN